MIQTIITDILLLIPVVSTIALAYSNLKTKLSNVVLMQRLAQVSIDKDMLLNQLDRAYEDKKLVESQEFMLFLNKTRDDAFEYIEKVQAELERFDKKISPILNYHETYGIVLGETMDWKNMEDINKAYKRLKKIMPDQSNAK